MREICCLQHGETESNVWNTFVWSCPTWPSRWGMRISIDWPRLKSCQAVCDECMRGEIYSSLSRDAGCSAMWTRRGGASLKFGVQSMITTIRVISFRYHRFPYSTIGNFLDPNIRVIRGLYCTFTPTHLRVKEINLNFYWNCTEVCFTHHATMNWLIKVWRDIPSNL